MARLIFLLFLISPGVLSAQYEAECFNINKEIIKKDIAGVPRDTIRKFDTVEVKGGIKYDTLIGYRVIDISPYTVKVIGCKMPDFNFLTIGKEEMSVNTVSSDFTILSFGSTSYGDVWNARLHQFCRLKSNLKDSMTVVNIYEERENKVADYAKNFCSEVHFVANADVLHYNYTLNTGGIIYLLDKYKNIIYVRTGHDYKYTPDEIYSELLEKIRSYSCVD